MGGKALGLCVADTDEWASRELQERVYRITHLMALGHPEAQVLIKSMLLQEMMRTVPRRGVVVADMPYADLTSVNALERMGFTATQTSLHLARDLDSAETDATAAADYEVESLNADDVSLVLAGIPVEMPSGFLGWDSKLPHGAATRVHSDWLKSCALDRNLLMARDHGRPVGILAEHLRSDTTPYLGFPVGTIDLVATIPEYRHNGVAGRLVLKSLEQFQTQGAKLVELRIHSADTPVAHTYQSQGFTTIGSSLTLASWRR
jgi:ribosomal protein S18 acetylase RimI-like enzyme